jgi:F1F0 ATPase subunit 2
MQILELSGAWLAGLILGAGFFGGLWLTVTKGLASQQAGLWFLVSNFVRTGLLLTGFYFVGRGSAADLCVCLFGFFCARLFAGRLAALPKQEAAA